MGQRKILSHKTRAMPTKPEQRGSGEEVYVLPPPHRTRLEVIEKQVMDRLLGKKPCVLGICHEGKFPKLYSGPLTDDDRYYTGRGVCPKCGFPSPGIQTIFAGTKENNKTFKPVTGTLRFERASPRGLKVIGTIRTIPENYFVAVVTEDMALEFTGIEAMTRNINQKIVERWWSKERQENEATKKN